MIQSNDRPESPVGGGGDWYCKAGASRTAFEPPENKNTKKNKNSWKGKGEFNHQTQINKTTRREKTGTKGAAEAEREKDLMGDEKWEQVPSCK